MYRVYPMPILFFACSIAIFSHAEIPGYEGECKQIIDRALNQYFEAKTYQDTVTVQKVLIKGDGSVHEIGGPGRTLECAFEPPNKLTLLGSHFWIHCDGTTYSEYLRADRQYTERKAPVSLAIDEIDLGMVAMHRSHPIVALVSLHKRSAENVLTFVKQLTAVKPESRDGEAGKRIFGRLEMKYLPIQEKVVDFDAWFSDATGLLREARLDLSEVARQVEPIQGMTEKDRFFFVLRFDDVALNKPISPEHFVFKPQSGDRMTLAMEAPLSPAQKALIGKEAPAIRTQDIDGRPASLDQLKGQIVLLYFWSTSCRGCIHELPAMQQLADNMAGKLVSVIAVNTDAEGSRDRVVTFLSELQVTLPQWLDPGETIGKAYGVSVLPHAVLIDPKGTVCTVYPGLIPEDGIRRQIDVLLAPSAAPQIP